MTKQKHPGGVAGRVFGRMGNWNDGLIKQCNLAGAKRMHDELSREARAILAEWDDHMARVKADTSLSAEDLDDILYEDITEQSAQRKAFIRLGLDLEREDES